MGYCSSPIVRPLSLEARHWDVNGNPCWPLTSVGQLRAHPLSGKLVNWQMHHALRAIDGKHVVINSPYNAAYLYYKHNGFYSIILLALAESDDKFLWVDVRQNGSSSDAQIFNQCELRDAIEDGTISFPPADPLPGDNRPMP